MLYTVEVLLKKPNVGISQDHIHNNLNMVSTGNALSANGNYIYAPKC